jgi:hypothetical protein
LVRLVMNPIKNPAEHREGEATGPEQRRGRLAPSKIIKKIRQSPPTIVGFASQETSGRSTVVPVMIIPVSIVVSIVLGQNPRMIFSYFQTRDFKPCWHESYGKS